MESTAQLKQNALVARGTRYISKTAGNVITLNRTSSFTQLGFYFHGFVIISTHPFSDVTLAKG